MRRISARRHTGGRMKEVRSQRRLSAFDRELLAPLEDLEIELRGIPEVPWAEFLINPRRLRGSDFLMRWSQGVWSEKRVIQALRETGRYLALPYGPSGTAPENDIQAYERYFLELEKAGLGTLKRPDLLVFTKSDEETIQEAVAAVGGTHRLPFTPENHPAMKKLLARSIIALESENSLWKALVMPDYGRGLTPQRRLNGKPGLPKGAVMPTIIVKEEDRAPIRKWQRSAGVKVHVWHIFFDVGYGIAFDKLEKLISDGLIGPTEQTFQAPNGITTTKIIYKVYYHYGYKVADATQEANLEAAYITDKNGHILPYVRFDGGAMRLSDEALNVLDQAAQEKARQS